MYKIDFTKPIHVYFIGIGGISMSGLAEILLSEGFTVSGSDRQKSALTESLVSKGANVFYGQKYENLDCNPDVCVFTSAISADNPERVACADKNIPELTRAELLGQLMKNYDTPIAVSGTHGKTTTTSMLSQILLDANTDPTLSIGGIYKSIGGNIRIGASEVFVTEACEYTNSFLSFFPKISIILNIEEDHLDFFSGIEDIRNSFRKFADLLPSDGTLIINGEIPEVDTVIKDLKCNVVTYGSSDRYTYCPQNITYDEKGCGIFTLCLPDGALEDYHLSVPGAHNIGNATAAIACAKLLDIPYDTIRKALEKFTGTDRRFEYKGTVNGTTIIDDYAHHPTEIKATLSAAQNYPHNKIWCIFQPHTYTRTKALLSDFADALVLADEVILADIYAAREKDIYGVSSLTLKEEIEKRSHSCFYFPSFDEIEQFVLENCTNNDLLITMGAGDVVNIANHLIS